MANRKVIKEVIVKIINKFIYEKIICEYRYS